MRIVYWLVDKIVWGLIVSPFLSAWLKEQDWAGRVQSFATYLYDLMIEHIGQTYFPWAAGILLGFACGVIGHRLYIWIRKWLASDDKLFEDIERYASEVDFLLPLPNQLSAIGRSNLEALRAATQLLFDELKKRKVNTPSVDFENLDKELDVLRNYVAFLRGLLRGRDLKALRRKMKERLPDRN